MVVKHRTGFLLSGTVLAFLLFGTVLASMFVAAPALAQDAQIDQLQRQINALQKQLQALQSQVTETRQQAKAARQSAKTAEKSAQTAQQTVQNIPANVYNAIAGPPSWFGGIHVSLAGSFVAMEGVWRQRNEISSGASDPPFSQLPFENSPLWHEGETRFSAQQSRLAIKASGDIDPAQHLTAYWENDWLGAAGTANMRESNSYNLRVRQAWLLYANENWHSHFLVGQAWSMLTANKFGILPLNENLPLTIDAQYVVGFNWARQPQVRFVQDWNKTVWFGVSVESSQTSFASNGNGVAGPAGFTPGGATVVPPGLAVNPGNTCNASGLLNNLTLCSNNVFPDVVEKVAVDPGWGHYEAVGIERWFTDEVALTGAPFLPAGVPSPGFATKTNFGWGVGGSVLLPMIPNFLNLQGSVLTGQGLGRYGSSQLADVTIGPDGTLKPLQTTQVLLGIVAHPWLEGLYAYGYAGQEQVNNNFWSIATGNPPTTTNGGYGNPAYFNGGCVVENTTSTFAAAFNSPLTGACTANVKRTQELTAGFWYTAYKGDLGQVRFGAQYEFVKLQAIPGTTIVSAANGPTPNQGLNPNNNIFFFSFRYYPFEAVHIEPQN
jgi:outer membrane murein-binding lipoprotein Lpp